MGGTEGKKDRLIGCSPQATQQTLEMVSGAIKVEKR